MNDNVRGLRPFHLTIGIDPGTSGAIAILHDGQPVALEDMPCTARRAGGDMVDGGKLSAMLRGYWHEAPGSSVLVALEQVSAMPGQGVSSMFRFGQSDGIVRGVVGAMRLPLVNVNPRGWKKRFGLGGTEKDASRSLALERFPKVRHLLARKKDVGRADAAFIALHAYETEQAGVIR
jgi:crossover junction endodeoxyribonuclease RuvC